MPSTGLASTEWPPTPVSDDTKALLSRFIELCDLNDPEAGKLLVEEVFTPDAKFMSAAGTFSGESGMQYTMGT
jgi:hypothetical protein